ncbi:MAG: FAD-dependent oxidoreductase [Betaproteobacteria bacterium]|nr:FAD-dependent oxidoreductase [Betaproteobacteria bacterium]
MGNLDKLFQPGRIGRLDLKNRIVMAAMGTGYCHHDGYVLDEYIAFMEERARGGAGLLMTGVTRILSEVGMRPGSMGIYDDKLIPGLRQLTDAVHKHDAKIFMQLHHSGTRTSEETRAVTPSAPSAIVHFRTGVVPRALTLLEIDHLIKAFGEGARRARDAGFDGVEVHGGHGYLICQFLSPRANRRDDKYGGSVLNRARFPCDIMREIRCVCGPDFPIIFRVSATEYVQGGTDLDDSLQQAPLFVEAGADALHVSAGSDEALQWVTPDFNEPPACLTYLAEAVKKIVKVPVIAVGKLGDPRVANQVLEDGIADFIAIGRPLLADAYLPMKAQEGRIEDIMLCIYCNNGCTENRLIGRNRCAVNPELGQEAVYRFEKTKRKKKIVVVGGGLAGMETATVAAERGHDVHLYEQTGVLGGQWIPATAAKPQIGTLTVNMERRLVASGANVHLNTAPDAQGIVALNPDLVVVATGAKQTMPNIPGADGKNIVLAWDVLDGSAKTGQEVVVVGGGLTGSDAAYFLARQGKRVSLINNSQVLVHVERLSKLTLKEKLIDKGVYLYPLSRAESITSKGVNVINDGEIVFLKADTVVIAVGVIKDNALAEALAELEPGLAVQTIGDAYDPRTALEAIHEGFKIATEA